MKKKYAYILLGIIILIVGSWMLFAKQKLSTSIIEKRAFITVCGEYKQGNIILNKKLIVVDISDNKCKEELGLSGRKSMTDSEGMLFSFDTIGNYGFWMKDMSFPLDIIWLDEQFNIVGAVEKIDPGTYPNIFGADYKAKYVLEVISGTLSKNNIKVGDKIIFSEK